MFSRLNAFLSVIFIASYGNANDWLCKKLQSILKINESLGKRPLKEVKEVEVKEEKGEYGRRENGLRQHAP
jgi:hypothetical protein